MSNNSNTVNQQSSPGTAMVWVNVLWSISLVLSLTCALIATLLQQWAHRYTETPKSANTPRHRAPRPLAIVRWHEAVQNRPFSRNASDTPSYLRILIFGWPRDSVSYDRQDGGHCC